MSPENVRRSVRVRVPATTANLGPGFDCLGAALDIFNEVELAWADGDEIIIEGEGAGELPKDASNLAWRAALAVLRAVAARRGDAATSPQEISSGRGWRLRLVNRIPLARGLGSSAAAIVGGMTAANLLLDGRLGTRDILHLALPMEGHPDNLAPCLTGGMTVAYTSADGEVGYQRLGIFSSTDPAWYVLYPDLEVSTWEARGTLPDAVPLADAVHNLARVALLVTAFGEGRPELLVEATADRVHQPYRRSLYPWLEDLIAAARSWGAYGAALSGAGPAVVIWAPPGSENNLRFGVERWANKQKTSWHLLSTSLARSGAGAVDSK